MVGSQLDPLLIPLLDRIQSQLDRVEGDVDRIGERFDGVAKAHTELSSRISTLETWRVSSTYAAIQSRESRHWAIGIIIAFSALAVSVVAIWVR